VNPIATPFSAPDLAHAVGRHPVPAVQQAIGRCYFPWHAM